MRRAIVVLTENRTASQSVFAALKPFEAAPDLIIRHGHGLDDRKWRGPPKTAERAARFKRKDEKEAELREILFDDTIDRTIVTIARDHLERWISDLWYSRHDEISRCYEGRAPCAASLEEVVSKPIGWIIAKAKARYDEVWRPLGLPPVYIQKAPKFHSVSPSLRRCTLQFRNIDWQFDLLLKALGAANILPVTAMDYGSLPHTNAGDSLGDPAIYAAFKAWCRPHLLGLLERAEDGPGVERTTGMSPLLAAPYSPARLVDSVGLR